MTGVEDELPPPSSVSGYLRSIGWSPIDASDAWARWQLTIDGRELILTVPLRGHAPDYRRRFMELVDDLRRLENRPTEQIVRDIRSSGSDVIRIRLRGASDSGRIAIEHGARAFQRARDLLLAAACAAVDKRPIYSRRKPARAMEYLNRTKFGPTEAGSFVLTIESSVPPQLATSSKPAQQDESGNEPEPFERSVCLALARATTAARSIVDQISVTSSMATVVAGVQQGVSSNLCEALAGLIDDAGIPQSVEMGFRWASSRPVIDAPRTVAFESDAAPFLWEMGRTLREQSTIADFELVGPVHKLTSAAPGQGGEIIVAMTEPWPGRKVRVALPGPAYQQAAQAHTAGLWISCEGELIRQSGTTVLLNPRNLRTLDMDTSGTSLDRR
jgi:hypothetical protein